MIRRKSMTSQISIVLSGCLLGVALFIFKERLKERPYLQQGALQVQIDALAKGALLYSEDHHDHLPSGEKWKDQLVPYVGKEYLRDTSHIALNRAVSGRSVVEMKNITGAILFFEAKGGPIADVDAIPRRSDTGAFAVSFVDGHGYARSLQERTTLIKVSKDAATFSP